MEAQTDAFLLNTHTRSFSISGCFAVCVTLLVFYCAEHRPWLPGRAQTTSLWPCVGASGFTVLLFCHLRLIIQLQHNHASRPAASGLVFNWKHSGSV